MKSREDGHAGGFQCEVCGKVISESEVIPKLPHTEVNENGRGSVTVVVNSSIRKTLTSASIPSTIKIECEDNR